MDDLMLRIALLLFTFTSVSSALQVTPNSPCSKLCLNDAGLSTISGSDIACNDKDYSKAPGQKFQKCIECLQTSSFGSDDENDQGWLIHNMRYAADWCMYAPDNAQRISGPCMDAVTCGGLESPLDVGNGEPKNSTTFNYCEKNGGRFGSEAAVCNDCVQHMPENKYLANWIVALQAGCSQRPSQKALIGLTGSIFDTKIVTISSALSPDDPNLKPKRKMEGLPMQAIIGIVLGAVVIAVIIVGVVGWKCYKRRKACKLENDNLKHSSGFDSVDIPAPLGGFSEYKSEPVVEVAPWDEDYMMKEMRSGSRTSGHSKKSSVSSDDSSGRLNPERKKSRNDSGLEMKTSTETPQEAARPSPQQPVEQERVEPAPQPRAVSPKPERNSTHVNPLRMNSYTAPSNNTISRGSLAQVGVAVTAPAPVEMPTPPQFMPARQTPTPPSNTPTPPPPAQPQTRSGRQTHVPSPLILQNTHAYVPTSQAPPSPWPGYASSIISSTSTTFSPGVYHSPPPQYQSPVRATFNQRPAAPFATYNPADYVPKPTNPYQQPKPQFNTHQRSYSPAPAQPSRLAIHRSQASVASTSSRFSFAASTHQPSPPPAPPQPKQKSLPKQKDAAVPIIALPIPAPKRQTVDLRNLVGMNLKQHISPESQDIPAMPQRQEAELPKGLDRTESLLAKSSPPFRSLARNLNPEAAMSLPPAQRSPPTLDEGTIQVQRPDSRASYRGRSPSRPRRESLPRTKGLERDRSGNRTNYRSRSRDVDLEGGDGRKKRGFSFGFRGQDVGPKSAVDERSPQSGATTDVEQWPGKM